MWRVNSLSASLITAHHLRSHRAKQKSFIRILIQMGLQSKIDRRISSKNSSRSATPHSSVPAKKISWRVDSWLRHEEERLLVPDLPDSREVRDPLAHRPLDQLHLLGRHPHRQTSGALDQSGCRRNRSKAGIEKSTAATELEWVDQSMICRPGVDVIKLFRRISRFPQI